MEDLSPSTINLLQYLAPGLVAIVIYRSLTARPHTSAFETIALALIFTALIEALTFFAKDALLRVGASFSIGRWTLAAQTVISALLATAVGVATSWAGNRDIPHSWARKWGISKETSFPSQWFRRFYENEQYIVLHLDDGRRLYGWADEWPSSPDRGHFILTAVSWLGEDAAEVDQNAVFLMPCSKVEFVEFVPSPIG